MTCKNCGTEFEGNFCPKCGTKRDEGFTCPYCGAALDTSAKFCNACGKSLTAPQSVQPTPPPQSAQPSAERNRAQGSARVYRILGVIPWTLFGLFSVALFLFYLGSAVVLPKSALLGTDRTTSYGNMYQMFGSVDIPALRGAAIALVVLAAVCVALTGAAVVIKVLRVQTNAAVRVAEFVAPYLMYLAFLIIAAVFMGKVKAADKALFEGAGAFKAGACPVLLLTFSIVFAVFTALSQVGRLLYKRRFPALAAAETERENAASRKVRREKTAPNKAAGWVKRHKALTACLAVLLVAAVVLPSTLVPIMTNKFRAAKVQKVEIGFTQSQVTKVLGEPYAETSTDEKWTYYSDKYLKIVRQIESREKEAEKAAAKENLARVTKLESEIAALNEKGKNTAYDYIEITFALEQRDGDSQPVPRVTSVLLDRKRVDTAETGKKTVKSVSVDAPYYYYDGTTERYIASRTQDLSLSLGGVPYAAKFSDGSFYRSTATPTVDTLYEKESFIWSDAYADYSAPLSKKVGEVVAGGVWRTADETVTRLVLPDTVTYLDSRSFTVEVKDGNLTKRVACENLTEITVSPDHPALTVENSVLYNKNKTKLIYVPKTVTGTVTLGAAVTAVSGSAFDDGSGLTQIDVAEDNAAYKSADGVLYSKDGSRLIRVPRGKTGSFTIPDEVTAVADDAFNGCYGITYNELTYTDNYNQEYATQYVGKADNPYFALIGITGNTCEIHDDTQIILKRRELFSAFYVSGSAEKLAAIIADTDEQERSFRGINVLRGETLTTGMFAGCFRLQTLYLAKTITKIEHDAFYGCKMLQSIRYAGTVAEWQAIDNEVDLTYFRIRVGCTDGEIDENGQIHQYYNIISL